MKKATITSVTTPARKAPSEVWTALRMAVVELTFFTGTVTIAPNVSTR